MYNKAGQLITRLHYKKEGITTMTIGTETFKYSKDGLINMPARIVDNLLIWNAGTYYILA